MTENLFTVRLKKHYAILSWGAFADVPAGHININTEDPLASTREARDVAELNLKHLSQLLDTLSDSNCCTTIIDREPGK